MRDTWGLLCPRTLVQALSEAQANAWECLKIAAKFPLFPLHFLCRRGQMTLMSGCFASIFMSCLRLTMFSSDAIQSGCINTSGKIFLTTNIKLKAKIIHRRQDLSDPSHPLAYETERLTQRYF